MIGGIDARRNRPIPNLALEWITGERRASSYASWPPSLLDFRLERLPSKPKLAVEQTRQSEPPPPSVLKFGLQLPESKPVLPTAWFVTTSLFKLQKAF